MKHSRQFPAGAYKLQEDGCIFLDAGKQIHSFNVLKK